MNTKRKCFEESNNVNPDWSFKFDEELQQYIALDSEMQLQVDEFNELWDAFRAEWQAARAQAAQGWVSVEDGLPSKDQLCVTMFSEVKNPDRPYLYLRVHFEVGRGLQSFGSRKAVYWMPLPDAPQEQK